MRSPSSTASAPTSSLSMEAPHPVAKKVEPTGPQSPISSSAAAPLVAPQTQVSLEQPPTPPEVLPTVLPHFVSANNTSEYGTNLTEQMELPQQPLIHDSLDPPPTTISENVMSDKDGLTGGKRKRGRPAKNDGPSGSSFVDADNEDSSGSRRGGRQRKPVTMGPVLVTDSTLPPPKRVK